MEDDKGSFRGEVCDEKVLVDMSLHPTPSEEVDPLKFEIKEEVVDMSDENEKLYSNVVIKEEVDSQSICNPSWKPSETVSVTLESTQVKDELIDIGTNSTQFSAGNDCLTMKDIKTEEHKSDFDGFETYYNSNIVVTKEEDLGLGSPTCKPILINSAADVEEPHHKKLSGDLLYCMEEGSGSDVYICDHCHYVYKTKQQIEHHLTHSECKCKTLHDQKDGYDYKDYILNIESASDMLRTKKLIQSNKFLSKDCHLVGSSDENITSLIQSNLKTCRADIYIENKVSEVAKRGKKKHMCKYCEKAFTRSSYLKEHERIHTDVTPYICKDCGKAFATSSTLKVHERLHFGVKPYLCNHCEKAFTTSSSLKKHYYIHTGVKPYLCKYCEKAFTQSSSLKIHERLHTGVKPYLCKYCEQSFIRSSYLKIHERIHTGGTPYVCKYCGKVFTTSHILKAHELLHIGVKPHVCKYCEKAFTTSSILNRHERIHTGIKPDICKYCKKVFTTTGSLKIHERLHTGVKPYVCKYCEESFIRSSYLKKHERIHTGVTPYVCQCCDKVFTSSDNLKTHELIHTGEKPHICKYCEKKFTTSSSLKRHERIHTGIKPYLCKYCEKTFTWLSYLKKHERIHTDVMPYCNKMPLLSRLLQS